MLKHLVLFKLKPSVDGRTKEENLRELKERLEVLPGKIPGILKYEIGINQNPSSNAYDLGLDSEFEDEMGLITYQRHPDHQAVTTFINQVCVDRHVVDWEKG